jgi:serine/threonine protein kinase
VGENSFLAMEHANAGTLLDLPPDAELAATLLRQAAEALDFIHAVGIVHGNLAPSSLLLVARGDAAPELRIAGFGHAVLPGDDPKPRMLDRRDAGFLPPELVGASAPKGPNRRTDQFTLGAAFAAWLGGRRLVGGRTTDEARPLDVRKLSKRLGAGAVAKHVAETLARMTDPDPAKRYSSARAIADALSRSR